MSLQWTLCNTRTGEIVLAGASLRASLFSRLIGLLFQPALNEGEGAIFVCPRQSRLGAAIHTLGMAFSIGVLWLDAQRVVVDARLAQPWRLAYLPKAPALYYVEAQPAILKRVKIGDELRIDEVKV